MLSRRSCRKQPESPTKTVNASFNLNLFIVLTSATFVALVFLLVWVLVQSTLVHAQSASADKTHGSEYTDKTAGNSTFLNETPALLEAMRQQTHPGGETSVPVHSGNAFSLNSANMTSRRKGNFLVGNDFFEDPWVIAPSSTTVRDGLGPLFNVSACQSCHINDGSGHAPETGEDDFDTMLIRLSQAMRDSEWQSWQKQHPQMANVEDENYGGQIQDRGIANVPSEMKISVQYEPVEVTFADGHSVTLRKPVYQLKNLNYGELSDNTVLSPRAANQMIGLGLLEAIPEKDILALESLQNQQNSPQQPYGNVSGKANFVWDIQRQQTVLGRFGWKAGQPTVEQQVAAAFNGDIGLTNRLFRKDHCLEHQQACLTAANGNDEATSKAYGDYEIRDDILQFVTFYSRNLAVPTRRNVDDEKVQNGAKIFVDAGCAACHQPQWQTSDTPDIEDLTEQSNQTIWPFTDMLLHDMGEALADFNLHNQPFDDSVYNEFAATAREWRTAPLWGIGLRKEVDSQATFLHDGRARNILEAVLWHGGEAEFAKNNVLQLSASEREALVLFLQSL